MPKLTVNFNLDEVQALRTRAPAIFLHEFLVQRYGGIKKIIPSDDPHVYKIVPGHPAARPEWPVLPEFLSRLQHDNKKVRQAFAGHRCRRWLKSLLKWTGQGFIILVSVWGNFLILAALLLLVDLLFPGLLSSA